MSENETKLGEHHLERELDTTSDEIRIVGRVSKDSEGYLVKCPHCERILGLAESRLSDIRGEQYQDRVCKGWLEVSYDAKFVPEL
jgi:hypothetical protein